MKPTALLWMSEPKTRIMRVLSTDHMGEKKMRKVLKEVSVLLSGIIILAAVFLIYAGVYYHADGDALAALETDGTVKVEQTDYGWYFDGPGRDTLIFYPGAKVEETAYAPLMKELAEAGMDACLVRMPLRLAFFGISAADQIIPRYDCDSWYLGGHSLGGVMASSYASRHEDSLAGLILLAAYPADVLEDPLPVLSIYGSDDRVLDIESYNEAHDNMPGRFTEYVIEGGNHAGFGNYGEQKGDGKALLSPAEQQEVTVQVIMETAAGW